MWLKPGEVSSGSYGGTGYEAAAYGFETVGEALAGWQGSPAHNDFILSNGFWPEWTAMGLGVDTDAGRYFLWLSDTNDPVGVEPCESAGLGDGHVSDSIVRHPASPNPFSSQTEITYRLDQPGTVRAVVFDTGGRVVRTLEDGTLQAGDHRLNWDGLDDSGAASSGGLYFIRIWTNDEVGVSKVIRIRSPR